MNVEHLSEARQEAHLSEARQEAIGQCYAFAADIAAILDNPVEILEGLLDGKLWVYEICDLPNLSGEWADHLTPLELARHITGDDDPDTDLIDILAEEYEEAVTDQFEEILVAHLRDQVGTKPELDLGGFYKS